MFTHHIFWFYQLRRLAGTLALCAVLACQSTPDDLQQRYRLEKIFFRAGKIAETIAINPRIAPAKNFTDAIALYRQVVEESSPQANAPGTAALIKQSLVQIARLEMMREQLEAAVATYRDILARFPDDDAAVEARLALGMLYQRSLEYHDAISAYAGLLPNLAARITPQDPPLALLSVPMQFARLHKFAIGDSIRQRAYAQAADIYREIIQASNSQASTLAKDYYATLLADQGRWEELAALLDQEIQGHADSLRLPMLLYLKAQLQHRRFQQPQRAQELLEQILAQYPEHEMAAHAQLAIATINLEQKNFDVGRQHLKNIIEKFRRVPVVAALAQEQLAVSFEQQGRWDLALNEYRWLIEQFETSPAAIAAPFHIADYYVRQNDTAMRERSYREALAYYQSLSRKYPHSLVAALAQEQLTHCFIAQKQWDEAVAAATNLSKVLDNQAGQMSSYLLLGNIYEISGQPRLAAKAYNQIITQFPQHPLTPALQEKVRLLNNS